MSKLYARHGDVDLFKLNNLPENLRKLDNTTVALGESSGHHHTIYPFNNSKVSVYEDVANLVNKYVKIEGGKAVIKHQEHEPIIIDEGIYKVQIEQGINPFTEQYQRVID